MAKFGYSIFISRKEHNSFYALFLPIVGRESILEVQQYQSNTYKERYKRLTHDLVVKDQVTRTPQKTGEDLKCFGRVSSSYYL
jgi:hypothetical protein